MGLSLLNELDKIKDKFFVETLAKLTDDKQKKNIYLIYRLMNAIQTWGTIILVSVLVSITGNNILAFFQ